jgi:hypothetical protein
VVGGSPDVLRSWALALGASGTVVSCCCHSDKTGADSEGQGVEEVGETDAHVDVVYDTASKGIDCAVHETERYGHFVFIGSECKCLDEELAEAVGSSKGA